LNWRHRITGFRSFNNSACKRVLNLLEVGYLRLWEVVVNKKITGIKFGVDSGGGGNVTNCCIIKERADTSKLANMIVGGFGER